MFYAREAYEFEVCKLVSEKLVGVFVFFIKTRENQLPFGRSGFLKNQPTAGLLFKRGFKQKPGDGGLLL